MIYDFDFYGRQESPYIILCNPNREQLYSLGLAYNFDIKLRYNAMSEISFDFPKSVDGGTTNFDAYDYLENKRLVLIENIGYFQITDVEDKTGGEVPIKSVKAMSFEMELVGKRFTLTDGTYKFWDYVTPANTLLKILLAYCPGWSISYVDSTLVSKYRTFEVSDNNVYNFLMNEVEEAYGCIFEFDTINRTISAYPANKATTASDIYLSYDNLIKDSSFKEKSDELSTVLHVYGAGDLDIRTVNPLGTDAIYNFGYYKSTDWMGQTLIDDITAWEALVDAAQPGYADLLSDLKSRNAELIVLEDALKILQGELDALIGVQKARIEAGLPLDEINAQIEAKQAEITTKENSIDAKEIEIEDLRDALVAINESLSFEENFTAAQRLNLSSFMFENTYQNENIIQLDSMTPDEIQDQAQELYDQAQQVLARVSSPRYEFSLNAVNFMALTEYDFFTSQFQLGSVIHIDRLGDVITTVALELEYSLTDPNVFAITFSNRLRLDNGRYKYSDLFGQVVKTGSRVNFNSQKWGNWNKEYKDPVSTFITSALDASLNKLLSSTNQEIKIDENGLVGKRFISEGVYEDGQVWLTSNILAFTDDSWQTAKLALGKITFGSQELFGIVAEAIVGNLIAGNTLRISNDNNNFVLDENGAVLTNASFTIQTTNHRLLLDAASSRPFRIQKREAGSFNDKFWVDNLGNVTFSGTLSGANGDFSGSISASEGRIGGWLLDSLGLYDGFGNYIKSDGNIKLGALTITASTAVFHGNIFAANLDNLGITAAKIATNAVTNAKILSLNAEKITAGEMSADRIFGGTIRWGGTLDDPEVTMGLGSLGTSDITAKYGIKLIESNNSLGIFSSITLDNGDIFIIPDSGKTIQVGDVGRDLRLYGTLYINDGFDWQGITQDVSVTTPSGTRTLRFKKGIYVGYT